MRSLGRVRSIYLHNIIIYTIIVTHRTARRCSQSSQIGLQIRLTKLMFLFCTGLVSCVCCVDGRWSIIIVAAVSLLGLLVESGFLVCVCVDETMQRDSLASKNTAGVLVVLLSDHHYHRPLAYITSRLFILLVGFLAACAEGLADGGRPPQICCFKFPIDVVGHTTRTAPLYGTRSQFASSCLFLYRNHI